jgi:segregation and condensation protein B
MNYEEEQSLSLKPKLEALLVAAGRPVAVSDLARCLEVGVEEIEAGLRGMEDDLLGWDRGFRLQRKRGAVRIEIKAPYVPLIGKLFPERAAKPLTHQAIETLAVVALKQPIKTADIATIRGVADSSGTVENMAQRGLIAYSRIAGVRHWHTTQAFLDRFNLASVDDLHDETVYRETFPTLAME